MKFLSAFLARTGCEPRHFDVTFGMIVRRFGRELVAVAVFYPSFRLC